MNNELIALKQNELLTDNFEGFFRNINIALEMLKDVKRLKNYEVIKDTIEKAKQGLDANMNLFWNFFNDDLISSIEMELSKEKFDVIKKDIQNVKDTQIQAEHHFDTIRSLIKTLSEIDSPSDCQSRKKKSTNLKKAA